jgi:hypothetical protein
MQKLSRELQRSHLFSNSRGGVSLSPPLKHPWGHAWLLDAAPGSLLLTELCFLLIPRHIYGLFLRIAHLFVTV